jgi:4-hydroxy-2-oxoheptanedioate aldolase
MRSNAMKAKMLAGEPVAGVIVASADEQLVEVLGLSGFDYVMIDCEHGHMSVRECETLVRACEAVGITSVVRVPHNAPDVILRHLDTGAQGIVIPQVNSVADARTAVDAVYYHPLGQRGLAGTRAADFGLTRSLAEYTVDANRQLAVIALIENVRAIDELPAILEVEGITAVTIGPADLSQSLGHPGSRHHPDVEAAIEQIITMAIEAGVPVGINTSTGAEAKAARDRGCLQTSVSAWGLLGGATRDYLAAANQ